MKKLSALATILVISGCETIDQPDEPPVIEPLVGKTLVTGDAKFVFNADGTVDGNLPDGTVIAGTYTSDSTQVCNTYTEPAQLIDLGEICSVPVFLDDTVTFTRTDGSQSPQYTIETPETPETEAETDTEEPVASL